MLDRDLSLIKKQTNKHMSNLSKTAYRMRMRNSFIFFNVDLINVLFRFRSLHWRPVKNNRDFNGKRL